MRSNSSWK